MDESLNSVNAEQTPVVEGQETVTGEGESAVVAEQQAVEEKPKQTPDENAAYKALRLQEKQDAVDKEYADLATSNGWTKLDGSPIRTKADYKAAEKEFQKLNSLISSGEDEEKARLKVQIDEMREREKERETFFQKQTRLERENTEFFEFFQKEHGRPISQQDLAAIPAHVYQNAARDGVPFKYAYAEYLAETRREKLTGIEAGKKTAEANAANATTTTGSVTGNGAADGGAFFTREQVAAMSQAEVTRNLDAIEASMKKWK